MALQECTFEGRDFGAKLRCGRASPGAVDGAALIVGQTLADAIAHQHQSRGLLHANQRDCGCNRVDARRDVEGDWEKGKFYETGLKRRGRFSDRNRTRDRAIGFPEHGCDRADRNADLPSGNIGGHTHFVSADDMVWPDFTKAKKVETPCSCCRAHRFNHVVVEDAFALFGALKIAIHRRENRLGHLKRDRGVREEAHINPATGDLRYNVLL